MLACHRPGGRILGAMAATQNYRNHAHRPMASALAFMLTLIAIGSFFAARRNGNVSFPMTGFLTLAGALVAQAYINRVYFVRLQDRIIRLEMRVRGASLLTSEQQRMLEGLGIKQVVALRFASDAELPALLERTAREHLKPADIKKAVTAWVPDFQRT